MWVDKISKRFLRRTKEGDSTALVETEGVYASWDAARALRASITPLSLWNVFVALNLLL